MFKAETIGFQRELSMQSQFAPFEVKVTCCAQVEQQSIAHLNHQMVPLAFVLVYLKHEYVTVLDLKLFDNKLLQERPSTPLNYHYNVFTRHPSATLSGQISFVIITWSKMEIHESVL